VNINAVQTFLHFDKQIKLLRKNNFQTKFFVPPVVELDDTWCGTMSQWSPWEVSSSSSVSTAASTLSSPSINNSSEVS